MIVVRYKPHRTFNGGHCCHICVMVNIDIFLSYNLIPTVGGGGGGGGGAYA